MEILAQYWMIPVGIAVLGIGLALLTLWQMRHRQQNKLALRVLAGQRRLLGEEIDERLDELSQMDEVQLRDRIQASFGVVDEIHVGALERQAHLQNLEDLAHLQRHKIAVLAHHLETAAQESAAGDGKDLEFDEPDSSPPSRQDLEGDLLGHISQHIPPKQKRRRP